MNLIKIVTLTLMFSILSLSAFSGDNSGSGVICSDENSSYMTQELQDLQVAHPENTKISDFITELEKQRTPLKRAKLMRKTLSLKKGDSAEEVQVKFAKAFDIKVSEAEAIFEKALSRDQE